MGTMLKQRNNHARSKSRRKALRLKNMWSRIRAHRMEELAKISAPKGRTLKGEKAVDIAIDLSNRFPKVRVPLKGKHEQRMGYEGMGNLFDFSHKRNMNQRQKRKKWASNPNLRRKQ